MYGAINSGGELNIKFSLVFLRRCIIFTLLRLLYSSKGFIITFLETYTPIQFNVIFFVFVFFFYKEKKNKEKKNKKKYLWQRQYSSDGGINAHNNGDKRLNTRRRWYPRYPTWFPGGHTQSNTEYRW